jgi:hypothetical protein
MANRLGDTDIVGQLKFLTLGSSIARENIAEDSLARFPVPFADFRVHDALQTTLPGTSASDDLGLYGGTFGSSQPLIRTYDVKAAGSLSLRARALIRLPECYIAGESVRLRLAAGMITTVADVACTVDVEAFRVGKDNSLGSDICATAAQSMNSLTFADKDFVITAASLEPGDVLDVRITIAVNDAATLTAVIAAIGGVDLLADIKG